MSRKKLLILLFIFIAFSSSAQLGVKLLQFRPSGELGAVMKKAITGEIIYLRDFDTKLRSRVGLCYVMLKPRLDTFPVQAVMYGGSSGTIVYPGYQIFHKYSFIFISGGFDYKLLGNDSFYLYPGLDILLGSQNENSETHYLMYEDLYYSGGQLLGGLKFRIGAEYKFNKKIAVFFEATRSLYKVNQKGNFSNNDIGLGCRYIFE